MKIINARSESMNSAVLYLRQGKSVVYPTDTCYGLAVDATNARAIKKLFKIKERGTGQPIHVIVGSLFQAKKIAIFSPLAEKLFKKFLPGPLTLVLPLTPALSRKGRGSSLGLLSADTGTIGIRMPKNQIALALAKKLGRPITTTSANPTAHLSGGYSPYDASEVMSQFEKKKYKPDLVIDAGRLPKVKPSTIVDLSGSRVRIIREGPVKLKEILNNAKI